MTVADIMTRNIIYAEPRTKVVEVAEMLFKHGYHGMPVVDDGKVVGMITENDFFIKDADVLFLPSYIKFLEDNSMVENLSEEKKRRIEKLLSLEARDIMTKDVVTVPLNMDVAELLEFIKKTRFNTLPVADDGKNLLGLVTLVDVIGMAKQTRTGDNPMKAKDFDELISNVNPRLRAMTKAGGPWRTYLVAAIIGVVSAVATWIVLSAIR
jgi:CBS domain-containing protein